jgi:hypothetical protein
VTIDELFMKVLGRPPSEQERERLYRLRDALGLRDNDAFWSIVLALEHYDAFFRQYPAQLAAETGRCIENARAAFAIAAEHQAAHVQRVLSERVAATSVELARKLAERPVGMTRIGAVYASVVAFGALCTTAGYRLATLPRPFWVAAEGGPLTPQWVFAEVLALPAGWMIFALLLPAVVHGAEVGRGMLTDPAAQRRDKVLGGALVAACLLGSVGCAVLLAKVIRS